MNMMLTGFLKEDGYDDANYLMCFVDFGSIESATKILRENPSVKNPRR